MEQSFKELSLPQETLLCKVAFITFFIQPSRLAVFAVTNDVIDIKRAIKSFRLL